MTGSRGGKNEGGGGRGKRDRRDRHPSLLWFEAVRDEAYVIYNTLDLCFPDTKANKSKTTMTITADNIDCNHDTVREGVKPQMESVQSTAASASSSLVSHKFLVQISGHTLVLRHILSSYSNGRKIIIATLIMISSVLCVSQYLLSFQKQCQSKHNSTRPRLRNTVVFGGGDGIELLLSPKSVLYDCSHAAV